VVVALLALGATVYALRDRLFGGNNVTNAAQPGLTVYGAEHAPLVKQSFAQGVTEEWRYDDATVVLADPSVVVAVQPRANGSNLVGLDPDNGQERWTQTFAGLTATVSCAAGVWQGKAVCWYQLDWDGLATVVLLDITSGKQSRLEPPSSSGWSIVDAFVSEDVLYTVSQESPFDAQLALSRWDSPARPKWTTSYPGFDCHWDAKPWDVAGDLVQHCGTVFDAGNGRVLTTALWDEGDDDCPRPMLFGGNRLACASLVGSVRSETVALSNNKVASQYFTGEGYALDLGRTARPDGYVIWEDPHLRQYYSDLKNARTVSLPSQFRHPVAAAWDGADQFFLINAYGYAVLADMAAGAVVWESTVELGRLYDSDGVPMVFVSADFIDEETISLQLRPGVLDSRDDSWLVDAATGEVTKTDYTISGFGSGRAVATARSGDGDIPSSGSVAGLFPALSTPFIAWRGSWHGSLRVDENGGFVAGYSDSMPGDTGPGFPKGTRYECHYTGQFVDVKKVSDFEYSMRVDRLVAEPDWEGIVDGFKVVRAGCGRDLDLLDASGESRAYLPGASTAGMPEEVTLWLSNSWGWRDGMTTLPSPIVYLGGTAFVAADGAPPADSEPASPRAYVTLLVPTTGRGPQAVALPTDFPSCPAGMEVVSWTQYPDGLVLICGSDKGFHVTVRHKGKDLAPTDLTFAPWGWTVTCKGGTVLTVTLGGGIVTVGDTTWTARGWSRATGQVIFPKVALEACPPDTVPLSLSTWNGGWLLVCGKDLRDAKMAAWDDALLGNGTSTDVTAAGAGFCVDKRTICAGPGEVVLSDADGMTIQRPIGADWFPKTGPGVTGDPDDPGGQDDQTVVRIATDLLFEFGSAQVSSGSAEMVRRAVSTAPRGVTIQVTGHSDAMGSDAVNLPLSQQRADAVAAIIKAERPDLQVETIGRGSADPVASETTPYGTDNPEGRALNRRVEIRYAG